MSLDVSLAIGDRGARSFAIAFAITQIVEVPIYIAALGASRGRTMRSPARSLPARAAIAFGASAITHPVVWLVMPALSMWVYSALFGRVFERADPGVVARTLFYGVVAETFAVACEALYLRAFGVRRALLWATAANAASVIVGAVIVRFVAP